MNRAWLIGRLTRDPEIRYANTKDGQMAVATYTLAVDRRRSGENEADFIQCTAFGRNAEFAEKYMTKGMKMSVTGSIQTGSYTDRDGKKIYTTKVVVDSQEFCESKGATSSKEAAELTAPDADGFINVPEGIDEDLPFAKPEAKKGKK